MNKKKSILLLLIVMFVGYHAFGFIQEKIAERTYLLKLETAQLVATDIKADIMEFKNLDGNVESEESKKLKEKLDTDKARLENAYVDLQNAYVPVKYFEKEMVHINFDIYTLWNALNGTQEAFDKKATRNKLSFNFVGAGDGSRVLGSVDFTDCMNYSGVDKMLDDYFMRKSMYYRSHR